MVGALVEREGERVGNFVGKAFGALVSVGETVGESVGVAVAIGTGDTVGEGGLGLSLVGDCVGAALPMEKVREALTAATCLHNSPEHTVAAEH